MEETDVVLNTYMQASFKKKPEYCDINIVLLQVSAK